MEDPDRLLLFFWEQRRSGRPLTGTRASAIKQGLGWDGARSFNVWLKLTGEGKLSDGASESDWPVVTPKGVQRLRSLDAIPADQSPAPAAAAAPPPSALDQPTNPRVDATALLQLVKNQGGSLIASDLFGELQLQLGWSNQRVEQAYRAVTHDGRLEVINASHAVVGLKQPGQADPELPPEWTGTLVPVKPVELTGGVDPVQTEVSQAEVDHATLAILELLSRDDVQARDRSQLIQRLVQLLSSPEEPITGSAIDQALNSLIFKDVVKLEGGFGNILLSHHRRPLVPPDENLEEADLAGSLDAGPIAAVADDTVDPDPGPDEITDDVVPEVDQVPDEEPDSATESDTADSSQAESPNSDPQDPPSDPPPTRPPAPRRRRTKRRSRSQDQFRLLVALSSQMNETATIEFLAPVCRNRAEAEELLSDLVAHGLVNHSRGLYRLNGYSRFYLHVLNGPRTVRVAYELQSDGLI